MNNDLIIRDALVEDFRRIARAQANARVFAAADAWEGAADRIANAPAVDAEPVRHGRWEKAPIYEHMLRCSACKDAYVEDSLINGRKWAYCPHCGAKMDVERDG